MWLAAGRPEDYQKIAMFWDSGKLDLARLDSRQVRALCKMGQGAMAFQR
jgi:hypothetical protein